MIRRLLVRMLFGADELAQHALRLVQLRQAAQVQNNYAKKLAAQLDMAWEQLATTKTQYGFVKADLEKAYNLELY